MKSGSVAQMNRPPLGLRPLRLGREELGERVEHRVAALAVDRAQVLDVVRASGPPRSSASTSCCVSEEVQRSAACLPSLIFASTGAGRRRPSRAGCPGERIFENVPEVEHVLAAVERVQRRQRLALVAQQPVGVVLEHEQLALPRDLDEPLPARRGERHAGRVLEGRHGVDELRPAPLARRAARASPRAGRCACRRSPSRSGSRPPRSSRTPAPRPGRSGASQITTSPGSTSVFVTRSITCWPPVVTTMSSGSARMPSAAITSAIRCLVSSKPSVGPYWSALAHDSRAIWSVSAANVSGGKVEVSGRPPASEITSGRAVIAIRSRIADERICRVRFANRPA